MSGFRRYLFFVCCSLVIPGCFHGPGGAGYGYMGQPGVYPQQMYAPPGSYNAPGSYAAPGTFITPPSNAPPYSPGSSAPGSTYEKDPVLSNPGQNNGVSPFYEDKKKKTRCPNQEIRQAEAQFSRTTWIAPEPDQSKRTQTKKAASLPL